MYNRKNNIGVVLENGLDMCLNILSLAMAYIFTVPFRAPDTVAFNSPRTMIIIFLVVLLQSFVFQGLNLYRAVPFVNPKAMLGKIFRANLIYYLIVEALCYISFDVSREFMLIWMLISAVVSTAVLLFKKRLMIYFVGLFRKRKHYSLRRVVIVGDNTLTAAEFVREVADNAECGMMVIGYVGDKINPEVGCDKLGSLEEMADVLDEYHPTDVVFAIDAYDKKGLIRLVNQCDDRCIKVYFLPVAYGFFKTPRQIEPIGSLPVINIHFTPLDNGLNAFIKRTVDIFGSLALIIATLPIMLVAAIGVAISSPGPIFFVQDRVGKMGRNFKMLKFRSMRVNVDEKKGWTTGDDPRKTRFGTFIRRTSIDELPQLFNVLIGDMSLVGPRPEVPHFVEYFKERIPLYMVKHYVKPGMTGLAQIKGLRGDTSVEERIHADIEYIEHWSLALDIEILLKTPFKAINKQEKYVAGDSDGARAKAGPADAGATPADAANGAAPASDVTESGAAPTGGATVDAAAAESGAAAPSEVIAADATDSGVASADGVTADASGVALAADGVPGAATADGAVLSADGVTDAAPTDATGSAEVPDTEGATAPDNTDEPASEAAHTPCKGKILYAASTMSHINNFHLDYIAALRAEGYEVKILARGNGADYNIPFVKKFFSSVNAACRSQIRRILEKEKFDIIFMNTSLAAFHIRLCLPKKNRPRVVNMVHGYLFSKDIGFAKRNILLLCERLLSDKTDSIIVMNEWDREVAVRHRLSREGVLFCHGMGAVVRPVETPPEQLRREHNCQDRFVMTFVGDLSARKNQEFLIYALNEIKEHIPNAVLWLVGDGIDADKLRRLAGEVDVSESVFFMGRRKNACDYMRASDLYVSASSIEGMPFNLIEAMGCGQTVLASAVKGHTDLISDGVNGFLFKFGSMDDFVSKVRRIHSGELSVPIESIEKRYLDFAKETVFDETLRTIKETFEKKDG